MNLPTKWNTFDPSVLDDEEEHEKKQESSNDFYTLQEGRNAIRFLPPLPGEKSLWAVAYEHWVKPEGKDRAVKFACCVQRCPACKIFRKLDQSPNKQDQKAAWDYRKKKRVYARVIVRGHEDEGVKILGFGKKIHEELKELLKETTPFCHPERGYDIIIKRKGTGLNTDYKVVPSRDTTALTDDAAQAQEWFDLAKELDIHKLATPATVEEAEEMLYGGDDDEGESSPKRVAATSKKRRTAMEDIEDAEYEFVPDDEEDGW